MSLNDESIKEYAQLVKKIKERNENAKTKSMHRQMDLNETFQPVIQATQEQTAQLKTSLEPTKSEPSESLWKGNNALNFYVNHYPKENRDLNYGIRYDENEKLVIGDKPVKIDGNKIIINDKVYVSTPNLWALIMEKSPDTHQIDGETLQEYKDLITEAGVDEWVKENYIGSYKQLRKTQILTKVGKVGKGITFLPSHIKSLQHHLRLLLGEFKAGNRATQNEIVAIVDNLLERKKISKTEAEDINNFLQNASD